MGQKTQFYIEMTDTFSGEANYCWVNRFIVTASSFTGAIRKVTRETGYSARCTGNYGDSRSYDVPKAAICYFAEYADSFHENQSNIKYL